MEFQGRDLFECVFYKRGGTRFKRDHERQPGLRISGPLKYGINVDSGAAENQGECGNDSRFILDRESQVVSRGEVSADRKWRSLDFMFMQSDSVYLARAGDGN